MENKIEIEVGNNKASGILNTINNTQKLIIMIHGLGGNINEHIFYNGYKFFNNNGLDVFRLDLYSKVKLTNNTVAKHSKDLEATIKHFQDQYNEIYLIGHSLGGPIILKSQTDLIKKIVLRDPVLDFGKELSSEIIIENNISYMSWGMDILIGSEMEKEIGINQDLNNLLDTKYNILYAGDSNLITELTRRDITMDIIEGADHCFNKEGNEAELLNKTLKFINN